MSRTTNDIDNVVTTLNSSGADTIYSIFQLVGMIVMMTAINWRLALITVIIIPVSGWIVTLISRFVRIALMPHIKNEPVTSRIKNTVDRYCNLHRPQIGGQVSSRSRNGINHAGAKECTEFLGLSICDVLAVNGFFQCQNDNTPQVVMRNAKLRLAPQQRRGSLP